VFFIFLLFFFPFFAYQKSMYNQSFSRWWRKLGGFPLICKTQHFSKSSHCTSLQREIKEPTQVQLLASIYTYMEIAYITWSFYSIFALVATISGWASIQISLASYRLWQKRRVSMMYEPAHLQIRVSLQVPPRQFYSSSSNTYTDNHNNNNNNNNNRSSSNRMSLQIRRRLPNGPLRSNTSLRGSSPIHSQCTGWSRWEMAA